MWKTRYGLLTYITNDFFLIIHSNCVLHASSSVSVQIQYRMQSRYIMHHIPHCHQDCNVFSIRLMFKCRDIALDLHRCVCRRLLLHWPQSE